MDDILAFRWRLAETIAWCEMRASVEDPRNSLRTPALLPEGFIFTKTSDGYTTMEPRLGQKTVSELQVIVDTLAETRAQLLRLEQRYPEAPANDLGGGRLLFYNPYDNLAETVEEVYSDGFFELHAIPPWDTWLYFIEADMPREARVPPWYHWHNKWLVSWVPGALIELAHAGRMTSSTDAIRWAEDMDMTLLKQLREAGILSPQTNEQPC
ncbi:MAG TPA: hypothetical protein VEY08_13180 [Chloroflexia bacterium]|nr:hypothetical protein [Chloroflexia bacterium]